ncbi:MAG: hypothetical protein M3Q56_02120, partial [Bacteroidota bacterium]|nr:hypothetical protein [Bacteroidota bacterium]
MKSNLYFRIMLPAILFLICGKLNAQHPSPPWVWAKAFYGTNVLDTEFPGPAIAVDPSNGAVYSTGYFFSTVADFDPGEGIFKLDSLGLYADMFISKLDDGGNFVWAKQISAPQRNGSARGFSIAIDPSGNGDIYTTGAFHGFVDFDPGPGSYTLLYSGFKYNNSDVFVSSLDSSGNFKWAAKMGGTGDAWGRSIVVDPEGKGAVYILGKFNGTIDFNPGAASYLLTTVGGYDFFIVKLDLLGNFEWAKSFGGIKDDIGFAMAVDPKFGDVYVAGDFSGQVNFNPDDSTHILTSGPNFDIFILKLDRNGNFVWVKPMFGTSNSKGGT